MGTLLEDTQLHVERMVRDLEGDQDYLPIMALRDHKDQLVVVGLMMPEEAEAKDFIADTMSALCIMHRATEAAFTSVAWMVTGRDGKLPDLPPSQCADRQEVVILWSVDPEGKTAVYTATMVRENNMAGVGVWEELSAGAESRGRFIDAIEMGIRIGKTIPPDMAEFLDDEMSKGNESKTLEMMVAVVNKTRSEYEAKCEALRNATSDGEGEK